MTRNGSLWNKSQPNLPWNVNIDKSFKIVQIFVFKRAKYYKNRLLLLFVELP